MDKIIQKIDAEFVGRLTKLQETINTAQGGFNNLIAIKEERMRAVREYYEALQKKEEADRVLLNVPVDIE